MSKIGAGMQRHREKMLLLKEQKQQAAFIPPKLRTTYRGTEKAAEASGQIAVQTPVANTSQNIELRLHSHLEHLSSVKSTEQKVLLKTDWLPEYLGYIDASLAQSPAPQNTVLMYLMVWAIDVREFELAVRIGQHAILNEMSMPQGFKRSVAEVLAENIGEACIDHPSLAIEHAVLLQEVASIVQGEDLVDEAHAKIYKAIGIGLEQSQPNEALIAYKNALRLNTNSGVKTKIGQLEKLLNRSPNVLSHDNPSGSQANTTIVDTMPASTALPESHVQADIDTPTSSTSDNTDLSSHESASSAASSGE